jgi:Arc/MetJ-type ribon-helix-helix transcriptional regulator
MPNAWSAPTSWTEVCQRVNGRRKYHSLRRLQARLRRQHVAQHLRHEGLGYGVRAQLARTLGVSKATITSDVRAILSMPEGDSRRQPHPGIRRVLETGQEGPPLRTKEETMSQRCTVRLPDMLYEFLQIEADARQRSTSDLIREALERLLGLTSDHRAEPPKAPEPAPPSPPHDCTERLLARLPLDVHEDILARARLLALPVSKVVMAMLIVQHPSRQPSR